jgi:hypothetical protein
MGPSIGRFMMADYILLAYERALDLVGVNVWEKLSDRTRATILNEELSSLSAERASVPKAETPDMSATDAA